MSNPDCYAPSNATGIVMLTAALMTIGLVMVASAGASVDAPILGERFWQYPLGRQAMFSAAGFIAMLLVSHGGHRLFAWRRGLFQPAIALFVVAVAGLVYTLLFGAERNGARRWVQMGPPSYGLSIQPSEIAKVALIVLLAAWLAGRRTELRSFWRGLLPAVAAVGLAVGLVAVEDFGTGALLAAVGATMLIVGGARLRHLLLLAGPAVAAMAALILSKPFRIQRLTTFLNIWEDPQGVGYHPIQSLVTIASGGIGGRGLGAGVQKYGYLPEARSDFIFSVICEETGLIGGLVVIALFVALLWLGWRVVRSASSSYESLLAFGFTALVTLQAAMNIAVVTVCAPTKGISLPLVSAGGSGVVFLGIGIGLLVSVARGGSARIAVPAGEAEWPVPADGGFAMIETPMTTQAS